jgi:8-oxo-dGTP pyrophosphatase MutT (NUDIX family)
MYKIYIGEVPIFLVAKNQISTFDASNIRNLIIAYDHQQKRTLYRYIDNLEKGTKNYDAIVLHSQNLDQLKEDFFGLFKIKRAGGGLVFNKDQQILAIHRMGYWDLPKGKQEKGESIEATAVREVKEETGIVQVELSDFVMHTYHCFRNHNKKRILKWSSWYKMYSEETNFVPQSEEGIERVVWIDPTELKKQYPIYRNILDLLEAL